MKRGYLGLLAFVWACHDEPKDTPALVETPGVPRLDAPALKVPDSPPFDKLDTAFEDPDFRIEVSKLRVCAPQAPFLPPHGHRRIAVQVEVTGKTERVVPVGPLGFSLEDSDGHRFGSTLAGCGPSFPSQNLTREQQVKAEVAFDVPEDARELRLVYEPFLVGRTKTAAFLALPR
jgi:hypothetical protein